jgi:hypothetical protein
MKNHGWISQKSPNLDQPLLAATLAASQSFQ